MNDDDLRLLAAFREDLDEETPGRLASVRATFLKQQSLKGRTMNARKSFFTPRRIAVVALPAVAAIALGAVALGSIGGGGTPNPPAATESQNRQPLAVDADAATALKYLAVSAANSGDAPGIDEGQFLLEVTEGTYHSVKDPEAGEIDTVASTWWDPFAGMQQAKYHAVENGETTEWPREYDEPLAPTLCGNPTPEYLRGLGTDPAALVAQFREEFRKQVNWDWAGGDKTDPNDEGHLMTPGSEEYLKAQDAADGELFHEAIRSIMLSEVVMTADQRAILWEALSQLKGVTRTEGTVEDAKGREGIALGTTNEENGTRWEVVIDPETSKVLGQRLLEGERVRTLLATDLKVVDSVDEN